MPPCPYPDKHQYPSRRAAKKGVEGIYGTRSEGQGRLVVYPCGGHWHVGHKRGGK